MSPRNGARQLIRLIWDQTTVEIVTHDGEHIVNYPRPETTGMRNIRRTPIGIRMKTADENPSVTITSIATRIVSRDGCVGVPADKFYPCYNCNDKQVTVSWNARG